jgi:hypothetical protein
MAKGPKLKAKFEVLARSAGLRLDVHRLDELYAAYGKLEAMIARVRRPLRLARVSGSAPAKRPPRARKER